MSHTAAAALPVAPESASTNRANSMYLMGLLAAFFWGAGTNFLLPGMYPVRGISVGDLAFTAWLALAIYVGYARELFNAAFARTRGHLQLVTLFVTWLLLSAAFNAVRYDAGPTDAFAILRMFYFSALIVFTAAYARKFGLTGLLVAFLFGILATTLDELRVAFAHHSIVAGLLTVPDQNVIGNMLGIGVVLCSVGILLGMFIVPLTFAALFAALSVTTFSKGAWLLVAIGFLAIAVAIIAVYPRLQKRDRRVLGWVSASVMTAIAAAVIKYWSALQALLEFKMRQTQQGSVEARWSFALAGVRAMADHPFVGLGFRNFELTYWMYPDLIHETGVENAHNVFAHIAAIGGIPAVALLLALFAYPFRLLWRTAPLPGLLRAAYVALLGGAFLLSGAVQLQLVFQPFFWFFTGLVVGWRWMRVSEYNVGDSALTLD